MELPKNYRDLIEPWINAARDFVEHGDSMCPIAFVGYLGTGAMVPVPLYNDSDEAKVQTAESIRALAAQIHADFIFMMMEAWTLPERKLSHHEQIIDRYGSIAESPYRIDSMALILETRAGVWASHPPIVPKGKSKKKRTFGAVVFRYADKAEGRLARLLPQTTDELSTRILLH